MPVIIIGIVGVICAYGMYKAKFGRHVLVVGSNEDAAKLVGVNVDRIKILVFTLSGLLAAISAVLVTSRLEAATPEGGTNYELDAIAATVIGGTSMTGCKANLFGTIIDAILMTIIRNGLNLLNAAHSGPGRYGDHHADSCGNRQDQRTDTTKEAELMMYAREGCIMQEQKDVLLVDVAYRKIKQSFVKRELKPGQKLVVQDLADVLRISPTPIKQALNRLVAEGLVVSIPRKGFCFKEISHSDIDDYFQMRLVLETSFLDSVIDVITYDGSVLDQLHQNIEQHKEVIESIQSADDYMRNYDIDHRFHTVYLRCAENQILNNVYESLVGVVYSYYIYGKQPKERLLYTLNEHVGIVKAFREKDVELVKSLITDHINYAWETVHLMLKIDNMKKKTVDSLLD